MRRFAQRRKNRVVSFLLVLSMVLTSIGFAFGQSESVKAASVNMRIDSKGNIVWQTESHVNKNSGKRFRTVGWNFSIYEDGKLKKTREVSLEQKNSKVTTLVSAFSMGDGREPAEPCGLMIHGGKLYIGDILRKN